MPVTVKLKIVRVRKLAAVRRELAQGVAACRRQAMGFHSNQARALVRRWEIYGDPTPDPANTETTVVHPLSPTVEP